MSPVTSAAAKPAAHPREDALLSAIEGRADELVALTRDLIRFPTVNPPGDAYRPCAEYLGERLRKRGFAVEYVRAEGSPGDTDEHPRINVIARWEGASPGPCVHFNSHIDVVEAGDGWTVPPFEGVVKDGRVYGRGACDMKGGLAASVIAVEALIDSGVPLPGALEISGTADEESGGYGGVAWLAERGWFSKPRVDHVIIPEPLNVDRVCIGHRGVWWSEITTEGRIAHGSMPFLGDNAIRHMGAFIDELERRIYPQLGNLDTAMPVVPEGARTPTLNINSLHGGQPDVTGTGLPAPVVADSCRIVLDRRLLIEEDLEEVKAGIHNLLDGLAQTRPGFRYKIRDLFEVRPSMTEPDRPVVRFTCEAVEQVLDKPAQIVCSPGTYDQKHIDRIGRLRDCIAYGPGILDLAHQPDEYVGIDDMVSSAKVMALSAYALLTRQA
ncbi:MAG: acetylornithine deacetylase/succinyl-diaminopimelate desuccinylase family protein [Phenylobacterium sp.]|uniref:acetylornithine deacetylase/succinyl-diaminopimelate desuccinylase family protein n=1 Tax=Phenylobacterium sp. TaxID=1871053 RepID=UPI0025E8F7E0|nr:acetylornithine deacetylase/succinyl-diaminopimelate desuccinylase family protein [Phenylobacterium sp.]MBI1200448.1 acetylornithine deacetylase/succinyl-diaminopimelate desuccinylase family protein [Phenylobacterium sp.]